MYQVIARKFRPKTFKEMKGQEALVSTLKNALRLNRLPYAYLFSGPKGTGKTSVARLLAKALNCAQRTDEYEPCNRCASCLEIQNGTSLDVLEIDGASNRGIDDIRKINETVSFSALSGRYKIYLIDEVHMLTKEAFNALLKTLEEPPEKVKFLFATTEPHKVLPTILSRCQRFQLKRISLEHILDKLRGIVKELDVQVEEGALQLIAKKADGGLRDAESLLDQILNFQDGAITARLVEEMLGAPSKESLFKLDQALQAADEASLHMIAKSVYDSGLDLSYYLEALIDHFRSHLLFKFRAEGPLSLPKEESEFYQKLQGGYSKGGLIAIIDELLAAQQKARAHPVSLTSLEQLFYKMMRLFHLESIGSVIKRLSELERKLGGAPVAPKIPQPIPAPPKPTPTAEITIDPTPSKEDLVGIKPAKKAMPAKPAEIKPQPKAPEKSPTPPISPAGMRPMDAKTETLLQFAAIELEGKITKK
ncbi:MAG: DNA polymerase III subunit gamma/tau [Chlamydiia bacterium]|nr:DNA polymerase III subunit gamma/tau [Chlamydiia bacterium]